MSQNCLSFCKSKYLINLTFLTELFLIEAHCLSVIIIHIYVI